mmetsp:Transcript_18276/g.31144  ORF Transcript_18276/g.31144 Transcript_18276/m.31144 type:complete len:457 (-) Transcript_18276:83-1453(-)
MPLATTATTTTTTSARHVAVEKELIPPTTSSDDDIIGMYNENVQTTYGRYPLTIASGKGCKLYTTEGEELLDFVSGIATCALGHAHPALTDAIQRQMESVHHVSNLYYIPAQAQLAKWICDNSVATKVFFCNSGAEANEAAIKLARKRASTTSGITDPYIISARQSFHGRTMAALTATGQSKYHQGFSYGGGMVPGFEYIDYNDIESLESMIRELSTTPPELEEVGRKRGVAAVMLECLQGEGGIRPGTPEFFAAARSLCDEVGAILICDEVQVGMGRSGRLWGYENLGIEPDVFTSAKALGGGVPIGAMMAKGDGVANVFQPGDHASTYGGNPLACAAGLAVAQEICDSNLLANVRARGQQLTDGLQTIADKYPQILGEIRGWGLLKGVEVQPDSGSTAGELVGDAMKEGLLLVPAGATVVRFVPPLIVTEAEIDQALEKFETVVAQKTTIETSQ